MKPTVDVTVVSGILKHLERTTQVRNVHARTSAVGNSTPTISQIKTCSYIVENPRSQLGHPPKGLTG